MRRGRGRNLPSSSSSGSKKLVECSRVYKKRAKEEEDEVDIISNLPEHILHHIFSFVDMKQAIQTCILSRRWRYFWGSLPTLKFTYNKANRKTIRNEFMDFVDRLLMFRSNSSTIDEFTLVTNDNIDVTDRLNTWILASVIRNVQQLAIHTNFPKKFHFHHSLFTCKSLTKLVVRAKYICVSLGLLDSISLPRLKTLSLHSVQFEDEDSTNQLFSNCPILESLTLNRCEFPHINVKISSPLLQHFDLSGCRTRSDALDLGPVETNFQLCAPNLISFLWSNDMSKHCTPKNLSSLVKANIRTDDVHEDSKQSKEKKAMHAPFMVNLFRGLHNVEDLTLSAAFLEVVTGAPYLLDSQPTKFCNLRCLKLEGKWRSVDCIHAISYLLKIFPNIETLFVEVHYGAPYLLEVQPTQCCNLRCLKLNTLLSRDCIYTIAYFLKISPKIENLSFTVSYSSDKMNPYWNPDELTSDSAERGDYWKGGLSLEGLLNHVKCFELRGVTGRINELEFIEILLKNAMLLEKLFIFLMPDYLVGKTEEGQGGRLTKFSEKVLTFPRVSSSVVIIFKSANELQPTTLSFPTPPLFLGRDLRGFIHNKVITGAPDLLDSQPTKFCNLRCLKLKGTWLSQGCIPAISYLLEISPNIETLCIDVNKAGNAATDLLDVQPTHFCNLRCLKMHTLFSRDWIYAIACLLKICPNTETLSYTLYHKEDCYEIMNPYCNEINSDRVIERDYGEAMLSLEGLLNHVKCFELCNVTGRINELEFIEILLKNAMQLEKLLIVFETTYSDTNGREIKFSEKVLTFPRASTSVVILFK